MMTTSTKGQDQPLLEIDDVVVEYPLADTYRLRREKIRALDGVSSSVRHGRTLGIVGESGSGKSTLGRVALRRVAPIRGTVTFDGIDLTNLGEKDLRPYRARIQSISQDPYNSLNPRLRVLSAVAEPLIAHGVYRSEKQAQERVAGLLRTVGLPADAMFRHPRSFSGGQLQRVSIARALALDPELVVADEPVSSLDVSIQAQILNLLLDLQEKKGIAFMFVSHDISVISQVADTVAVMYAGQIVEFGDCSDVLEHPRHPYTEKLIDAVPVIGSRSRGRTRALGGEPPDPLNPPSGCRFRTRCPIAQPLCSETAPPLAVDGDFGHQAACWFR